jgi:hypothetical protein
MVTVTDGVITEGMAIITDGVGATTTVGGIITIGDFVGGAGSPAGFLFPPNRGRSRGLSDKDNSQKRRPRPRQLAQTL